MLIENYGFGLEHIIIIVLRLCAERVRSWFGRLVLIGS